MQTTFPRLTVSLERVSAPMALTTVAVLLSSLGSLMAQPSTDPPPPGGLFGAPAGESSPDVTLPASDEAMTREERHVTVRAAKNRTSAAVHASLDWLGRHQLPDGGWSFLHTLAPTCQGSCGDPGSLRDARNAATGLALLAYLGAGLTHQQGDCQEQVKAGLQYLLAHQQATESGGTFKEDGGTMYSHGIAALALCEAYGLSRDKWLLAPAQKSVDYIVFAQDPVGGGWRYQPRQPGDTSVLGWQLSALRAADLAGLEVPQETFRRALAFLQSVQSETGLGYGYTQPGMGQATTVIGNLMRMYLEGEAKGAPAKTDMARIVASQPSKDNMYYNYYASQLLEQGARSRGGKWRAAMREHLLSTQCDKGHEAGSWYFGGQNHVTARGGRLLDTAMAALTLEVYYRHLPTHQKEAVTLPLIRTDSTGDDG